MSYPYRYAPGCDVLGAGISAIFNHRRRNEVLDSLSYHKADDLDPNTWYPVDKFIDIFAEWIEMPGGNDNVVSVGMAMIYHLELPPAMERLKSVDKLLALGDLHLSHHRGDIGRYQIQLDGQRHIVITENTIWPDGMIYGFVYGAAQHFFPERTPFTLSFDTQQPRQDEGGEFSTLHLTW